MDRLTLSLAGFPVAVSSPCLSRLFDRSGGFSHFLQPGLQPLWQVSFDHPQRPWPDGVLLSSFHFSENGCQCLFLRKSDDYQFLMRRSESEPPLACLTYRRGSRTVLAAPCSDVASWRFALWFALSLLGADAGVSFVHSSVVVFRGQAVLFLGESGTGKSTHSRLWLQSVPGCHILNDDSPFLSLASGAPVVFGSPWSGKSPVFDARHFPLKAIVRLSQAPRNAISRLSLLRAFASLQPSLPPALMQDDGSLSLPPDAPRSAFPPFADVLVDLISQTLSQTPVYHLQCLPNPDAALLCAQTLFGPLPSLSLQ